MKVKVIKVIKDFGVSKIPQCLTQSLLNYFMPLRIREITRWVMYIYHYTFLARIKSVLISSGNYIFKLQWL